MAGFDFSNVPKLNSEEEKDPYSKFYYYPVSTPPIEKIKVVEPENQMPKEWAIMPDELSKLFNPGYFIGENGYTVLDNLVGCCAVNTRMPGVTPQMEEWWNDWFRSKDLYYKIWLPGLHFGHQNVITEDLGDGNVVELNPYSFVDVTKSITVDPHELDSNYVTIMAGSMYHTDEKGQRHYCSICHHYRIIPGGLEIRTRSWIGLRIEPDGSYSIHPEKDYETAEQATRLMCSHHIWEFHRKAELLPELFEYSKTIGLCNEKH